MDFIEGLPRSGHFDCILIVVDKFTQYDHFIPLSHPYTAQSVASIFMNVIYKLHGLPASIISGRDPVFTSKFLAMTVQVIRHQFEAELLISPSN
jgi:hypothetical protein